MIIKHAKEVPDCRKYQDKLLIKWCPPDIDGFKGRWSKEEKVTLFTKLGKESKGKPSRSEGKLSKN